MKSRWERGFAIGLAVLLLVLALAAQFLQSGTDSVAGSAASSEPAGRRALSLLLHEVGFRAETWSHAPGELPHGREVLWLARTPSHTRKEKAADEEADKEAEPSRAETGLRGLHHYRRFVAEGGTLILPWDDVARDFLVGTLGIAAAEEIPEDRLSPGGVWTVREDPGAGLEVELGEDRMFDLPGPGSGVCPLWPGESPDTRGEQALAIVVPFERGQIVVLGDDAFLQNGKIGDHDHALLAVRLAEEFAPGRRVLFDEYALGLWTPRTPIGILASPSFFLASLHLFLLLALLVVRSAWVREFPRDPAPLESASPLLRARSLAALLARAGRFELLARWLKEGTARRLDRRAREAAARVREIPPGTFRNADDLERLQRTLAAIEGSAG